MKYSELCWRVQIASGEGLGLPGPMTKISANGFKSQSNGFLFAREFQPRLFFFAKYTTAIDIMRTK
jgi:hypothetical protein